jgi:hypothetical protein
MVTKAPKNLAVCLIIISLLSISSTTLASDKYGGGSSGGSSSGSSGSGGSSGGSTAAERQRQANREYNARTLSPQERGMGGTIGSGMTRTREMVNGRMTDVYRDSYTPGGGPPQRTAYRTVDEGGGGGNSNSNYTPGGPTTCTAYPNLQVTDILFVVPGASLTPQPATSGRVGGFTSASRTLIEVVR